MFKIVGCLPAVEREIATWMMHQGNPGRVTVGMLASVLHECVGRHVPNYKARMVLWTRTAVMPRPSRQIYLVPGNPTAVFYYSNLEITEPRLIHPSLGRLQLVSIKNPMTNLIWVTTDHAENPRFHPLFSPLGSEEERARKRQRVEPEDRKARPMLRVRDGEGKEVFCMPLDTSLLIGTLKCLIAAKCAFPAEEVRCLSLSTSVFMSTDQATLANHGVKPGPQDEIISFVRHVEHKAKINNASISYISTAAPVIGGLSPDVLVPARLITVHVRGPQGIQDKLFYCHPSIQAETASLFVRMELDPQCIVSMTRSQLQHPVTMELVPYLSSEALRRYELALIDEYSYDTE